MKRAAVLVSLFFAIAAEAATIDLTVGITNSGFRVTATGLAQYMISENHAGSGSISGNLALYESNLGYSLDPYLAADSPWISFTGRWEGSFTYQGDYALCYSSGINAHASDVEELRRYSNTFCFGPPSSPPPESHGYQICPLILDLDGDGIPTTGLENTVAFFDTNHDGIREWSGWTAPYARDAFLWMDMNDNGRPDPGELFGAGMPMPEGGYARNGFQAVALYDDPEYGGNGDGQITRDDAIWDRLRLWIDANHDGLAEPHEISTPGSAHILAIDLNDTPLHRIMSNGNVLMYLSWMTFRGGRRVRVADISFIPAAP